jgi:preprotein translocase subunit SecD
MLNRYPLWKNAIVLVVVLIGLLYALPNLYPPDPAIQITAREAGNAIQQEDLRRAALALEGADIQYFGEQIIEGTAIFRLQSLDDQRRAKDIVKDRLGTDFVVALNKASTTPTWLADLGGKNLNLGLDLAGGVHFLMEVDLAQAVSHQMDTNAGQVRKLLREARDQTRYRTVNLNDNNVIIASFQSAEFRDAARSIVAAERPDLQYSSVEGDDGLFYLNISMSEQSIIDIENEALTQNLTTLRDRVNKTGVAEALVQRQGRNRVVVELPGVQDAAQAKADIGSTANIELRLEAEQGALVSTKETFPFKNTDDERRFGQVWLQDDIILEGNRVVRAVPSFDQQNNQPQVSITLDSVGGSAMTSATKGNVGRQMAVVYIEYITEQTTRIVDGKEVVQTKQKVEKEIISYATIQAVLSSNFVITGLPSPQYASDLARQISLGALSAPMYFVEERVIGPSLGAENIRLGINSVILGMSLVLLFMLVYYKVFGLAANLALTANVILICAAMSLFNATLTLPGIAGIVLTVGMSVDANVLIFSRIREELKNGLSPHQAINAGYEGALSTIIDANLTTLIVAFILWGIGSGPIQGFAVTLSIGILTSMFTAILGTRALINWWFGGRKLKTLWI